MNYIEVAFTCQRIEGWQQDLLINDLAAEGYDTFEETDGGFNAFIPEPNFNPAVLETLLLQLSEDIQLTYEVINVAHQNWNKIWEDNFQPLTVGDACYVRATFHESKADDYRVEIVIDPKMAFGTGHHQTTSLMMEFLLEEEFEGKKVLDMGCGTGILGILALKLGAESVLAIDNDPVCCESSLENAKLNQVEALTVICGDKQSIPNQTYATVIANINRNILLDQLPSYAQAIEKGGTLFMSGFYEGEDLEMLKTKANSLGLEYVNCKIRDRWTAAKFIRH